MLALINYSDGVSRIIFVSITALIVVSISLSGCSSSKKSAENEQNGEGTDGKISVESLDLTPPENLAPGTAQVRLSVQKIEEMFWTSEVQEVLGYGSSTPPLGIGKQIYIDVTTYFKNTNENSQEMAERGDLICVIRHRELRQGTAASSWSLVKVFEQ